MKLVIAEKPSVAQSIAKVIGADQRQDGYLEGNGYAVSWCYGHLIELAQPQDYDEKYQKWRQEDLPVIPDRWKYLVSRSTQKQFGILKKLMERKEVTSLVEATDAGREGELIFRLVYEKAGCRKPFERLWISSMEDAAIRKGFEELKSSIEYDALYASALCRERADWMFGINATRLFSCLYGTTLNVGRVMTPTLAMAVDREKVIAAFVPESFYTVQLSFGTFTAVSSRLKDKTDALALAEACGNQKRAEVISVENKERSEKPPLLFDLTSLQREANCALGYTAKQTLDYLQSLYEKKLVTYPRTDSRYLTDDMKDTLSVLCAMTAEAFEWTEKVIVHPNQVINSSKVTDHHAVIPTKTMDSSAISSLPKGEKDLLKLVTARLLMAVEDPCLFTETVVKLNCSSTEFTAKGRVLRQEGWKKIEAFFMEKKEKQSAVLPDLAKGMILQGERAECKEGKTSPPKHFTEDTLLAAMETVGADETPDEAERKGLGTPATRAGIIEKLISRGFMERKSVKKVKYLIPTEKGISLIAVMPENIRSPLMTAEWEQKLLQVEHGILTPEAFMDEIEAMITELVKTTKGEKTMDAFQKNVGPCPCCGSPVIEREKGWFCSNRDCRFALWKNNAYFRKIDKTINENVVSDLLNNRKTVLRDCTSSRTGKKYDAVLHLSADDQQRAQFHMEFEKGKS